MAGESALARFHASYTAARGNNARLEAIWRFREEAPAAVARCAAAEALPVLEALLDHARRDWQDARFAAARLLRTLWRGLDRRAMDVLFIDFTPRLIEASRAAGRDEGEVLWDAVEGGFEVASRGVVEAACLEFTAGEVRRCLEVLPMPRLFGMGMRLPPPVNFGLVRLITEHAPAGVWPRLVRDLWLLYNLDIETAASLGAASEISMRRSRAEVRRTLDRSERIEFCWYLARRMLHRTFGEARPEHLGDAAPGFYAWLEELVAIEEEDLAPLVPLMVAWAAPPLVPVLELWAREPAMRERMNGALPRTREFQRNLTQAVDRLHALLGITAEVVPAPPPQGLGSEVAPSAPEAEGSGPGGGT